MERLTAERGDRTWKLYHLSWYLNLVIVMVLLGVAFYFYMETFLSRSDGAQNMRSATMLVIVMVVASVLLLGAGLSRYQARLEGQHLELKLALKQMQEQIEGLKKQG